jgi:peptide/nickel transport system permease protein
MATNTTDTLGIGAEQLAPAEPGQLVVIWRRFRKHKLAVFGLITLIVLLSASVIVPMISGYAYDQIDPNLVSFADPSPQHWLGTDDLGRDLMTRLMYAGRISLFVGISVTLVVVTFGSIYGAVAGYNPGILDSLLMRLVDLLLSLPFLPLLLLLSVFFHAALDTWSAPPLLGFTSNDVKALLTILIILSLFGWLGISRLVRGSVLALRNLDFIEATRALGAGAPRIIFNHLIPNSLAPIIVASTLYVGEVIILESALSFLGLGINPPTPSWGNMLNGVQEYMWSHPLLAFYPGILILLTVLSINFMGDALRDALDPRLKM